MNLGMMFDLIEMAFGEGAGFPDCTHPGKSVPGRRCRAMRKPISLLLFLILSFVLYSQENLILHRLYMDKPAADAALAPDALFFQAPDTLFNLINTRQPVILSSRDEANSRIETEILSVKEGTEVQFTLLRDDAPLLVSVGGLCRRLHLCRLSCNF